MTEIYLHFLFSHYGLYANAPVGSLIVKDMNKVKAMSSRDAFCKATFQAVFADIVNRCNASVGGQKEEAKGKLGVLDIFGFERMQFNSLEQICINYTNEKLHQVLLVGLNN